MKKTDLNVLERLLNEEGIKGKKLLRRFIWLNTVEPKYKEGEVVKVTDRKRTINGSRVIDWVGTVKDINTFMGELKYIYTIKVKYISKDNTIKETIVSATDENIKKTRVKNYINKPINTKDEESIDINIGW